MMPYTVEIPPSFLHFNPHLIADLDDAQRRQQRIMRPVPPASPDDQIERLAIFVGSLEQRVTVIEMRLRMDLH